MDPDILGGRWTKTDLENGVQKNVQNHIDEPRPNSEAHCRPLLEFRHSSNSDSSKSMAARQFKFHSRKGKIWLGRHECATIFIYSLVLFTCLSFAVVWLTFGSFPHSEIHASLVYKHRARVTGFYEPKDDDGIQMLNEKEIQHIWVGQADIQALVTSASSIVSTTTTSSTTHTTGSSARSNTTTWLYSLVSADYGGESMLPHWVTHYLSLGVSPDKFIILINRNSAKRPSSLGLEAVIGYLESFNIINYWIWDGQYSSEVHLKKKLEIFGQVVTHPDDWIVLADSDEFQYYGRKKLLHTFLDEADREGATYIRGTLVDRLARDGSLPKVTTQPSIHEQFPMACAVVGNLYGGKTKKIAAFKAFLRSNQGNHKIVKPEEAQRYFAGALPGESSPRGGFFGSEDIYPLTPYAAYPEKYYYGDELQPGAEAVWDDISYRIIVPVFHFKWHSAVLENLQDRAEFYRGDAEAGGLPRYKHYQEAETAVAALQYTQKLDLSGFGCRDLLAPSTHADATLIQSTIV